MLVAQGGLCRLHHPAPVLAPGGLGGVPPLRQPGGRSAPSRTDQAGNSGWTFPEGFAAFATSGWSEQCDISNLEITNATFCQV